MPRMSQEDTIKELRNWDLWGPLLLCMVLSLVLSATAPQGQASLVFAAVFVVVWGGAAVVTVNAQLLGGKVSFFQSVCVLGYCVFPIVLASFLCLAWANHIWRAIIVVIAFLWSTRASVVFMSQLVNPDRKVLAAYPTLLFYLVLCWMVFIL
jgi:protein YIPF6